jgi:RHS repeat-associated protein
VVISETLPENTTSNASLSSPGWQQVGGTDEYRLDIGVLNIGETDQMRFVVNVDNPLPEGTTAINNQVSISDDKAYGTEPNLDDNSDQITTLLTSGPTNVCGLINTDTVWKASESPYVLTCDVIVDAGVTLTMQKGVIVKFNSTTRRLTVNGMLNVQGEDGNPVYFTSYKDDSIGGDTNGDGNASVPEPGNWRYISVGDNASATFDHTIVRYGGYKEISSYEERGSIWMFQSGTLTLRDSEVSYSKSYGVDVNDISDPYTTTLTIERSTIANNTNYGIYASADSAGMNQVSITDSTIRDNGNRGLYVKYAVNSSIHNSNIFNNGSYGVYNGTTNIDYAIDARYNWWGSESGPSPFGSGDAINGRNVCDPDCHMVYDIVWVNPWLGSEEQVIYNSSPSSYWSSWVAEPVNTIFGNYVHQHTDMSIPALGPDFTFHRTYNSNMDYDGPLGKNWTHNYNIRATMPATSTVVIIQREDGRKDQYIRLEDGSYDSPPGVYDILESNGITYTLILKDQNIYTFDTFGLLESIRDRNGNTVTLGYSSGNLTTIAMADGRVVTLTYNGSRLNTLTDSLGRVVHFSDTGTLLSYSVDVTGKKTTYEYDSDQRLTTITDANDHTFVNSIYDSNDRVIEQRDADLNLTTFEYYTTTRKTVVIDPRGVPITYTYNTAYCATGEIDAFGNQTVYQYDTDNNRIAVTDKRGNTSKYTYDDRGNITQIEDPLGNIQTFTYDNQNNLISQTDARGNTSTFTYDANGNRLSITNPISNVIYYSYYSNPDRLGLMATKTDKRGNTTQYDYNAQGDLILVTDPLNNATTYAYDLGGRRLSMTDALDNSTTYAYDAMNRILTQTDDIGGTITHIYDAVGNLINEIDPLGRVITYTYDVKDQLISTEDVAGYFTTYSYDAVGNRLSMTDGNLHTTYFSYDSNNQLIQITDPLDNKTSFEYDPNGNRISATDPLTKTTTYIFDDLNRQTTVIDPLMHAITTTYDAVGNILSTTDANHNTTSFLYDEVNRLIQVSDPLSGMVSYQYDANDNRISVTDANSHIITYTYDVMNQMIATSDTLGHLTSYTYDAVGNQITKTDPKLQTTTYSYDDLYRLTEIEYEDGTTVNYTYDAVGNRLTMTDDHGITDYTYDDLNRPLTITSPQGNLSYSYDAINRLALTTPAGTTTYTYDEADQLTQVTDWNSNTTNYTYDSAGRQTEIIYPNGVTATKSFDDAGRITGISYDKSGNLETYTYTLDAVGNRLSMTDEDGTTNYSYDALNRISDVTYPSSNPGTVSYTYDAMGNRLTMTEDGIVTTYNYDDADRLLNFVSEGITTTLTWDNNSNLLSKGTQSFTWNSTDRLIGLTNSGINASYAYNGDGVRIERQVDGQLTTYLQDLSADLPVVLRETTSGTSVEFVYGSDLLESIDAGAIPTYYHTDGLGSTRLLTNNSGAINDRYSYDVFGEQRSHTGSSSQPFTFTGEQHDPEAGLTFLRARYYDPEVGRFISIDPQSRLIIDIQGLNRFSYVQNNPLIYTDAEGEFVITAIAVGVLGYTAYKNYSAWNDFLDNTQNLKNRFKVHYSGDFDNPEWQSNEDELPKTIHKTLGSVKNTAVSTPGTSLTGKIPTKLDWTVPLNFVLKKLFLPNLSKPKDYKISTLEKQKPRYNKDKTNRNKNGYFDYFYTDIFYNDSNNSEAQTESSWNSPPGKTK